jgi:CCR4-NOT transcriptional regulation complex NOT5 subunit
MTDTTDRASRSRFSLERSQGTMKLFPKPDKLTYGPERPRRLEKRVSIDLIPTTLEEIEWALEDARAQERKREQEKLTPAPERPRRLEKRVSIDLIPTTLEEIEWALEDARAQEREREQV